LFLPGGDASEDPNGQDDEKGSHAGASVAGPQRTGDDVVALEGNGQDSQHRGVGHRQFHERHQFTFGKEKKKKNKKMPSNLYYRSVLIKYWKCKRKNKKEQKCGDETICK
jgi:hypothetical protein